MLRTLIYYWRTYLAVASGAAVATAVLAGAFMVGDSVRGSLRELTLDRLGDIDRALVADRFFRESLAQDLSAEGVSAAPAIVARGSAGDPAGGARASRIGIYGVDARFVRLFGDDGPTFEREPGQVFPSVVINQSLARELDVEPGQSVLLSFGRSSEVPRETLLGETDPDDVLGTLRGTVTAVIPDRGMGRFALTPRQQSSFNAFVDLKQLQRSLEQRGRINALFTSATEPSSPDAVLPEVLRLEDLGLSVERRGDHLAVESSQRVIRPVVDRVVRDVVTELGAPILNVQSYLLNRMQVGDRVLPYSLVAALDPQPGRAWAAPEPVEGTTLPYLGDRGILLNAWAARELQATPGDELHATYYVVGPREKLSEEQTVFRVEGIVASSGLGADRSLTPDYPGIQDADDMADWDPPFPVDLDRIRQRDEDYWDAYGAAPKAFVSSQAGRELWSTRFGHVTSVRVGLPEDADPDSFERALRHAMLLRLPLDAFGMSFRPIREEGLRQASGATDFTGLFVGFSFFLIVSAALLVGLLFRLGVEQRAAEVGVLLALGYRVRSIRWRLLLEAAALAGAGGLLGMAGGVGYAWLMMAALRTVWLGAVGSSELYLHVAPSSPILGWTIAVAIVLLAVAGAVRALTRLEPTRLLAGGFNVADRRSSGRAGRIVAVASLVGALGLAGVALATGASESPALAFGTGALLLISGLAWFALWCRGTARHGLSTGLAGMAARNSSWNPGRSVLSVALVACACFVIVTVAANREDPVHDPGNRGSGTGGFRLAAEADVPLLQDLNDPESRFELGFAEKESAALEGVDVFAFRLLPGEDASCLNLYRPEKPRLVGVGERFIERGGFEFREVLEDVADPWSLLEQPLEPGVIPAIGDLNSVKWILHLGLGKELTMEDEFGEPVRLRLVALLAGSIFQSELLISEQDFLRHFPSATGDGYFLVDTPAGREDAVAALLEKRLAPFGFDASTTREKLAAYKVVEHTYLSTFQLLGGLGLLLGTLGLGVVLVRNVMERRRELATLRAFGFPRRRLARLVLAENLFLLVTGIALGTLTALAAVAPRLTHLRVPWASLALTLLVVLLVGTAAGAAAVRGVLAMELLPSLKEE